MFLNRLVAWNYRRGLNFYYFQTRIWTWEGYRLEDPGVQQDAHSFLSAFLLDLCDCNVFQELSITWMTHCLNCDEV